VSAQMKATQWLGAHTGAPLHKRIADNNTEKF